MKSVLMSAVVKPLIVLVSGIGAGIGLAVFPCYLFPLLGWNIERWCNFLTGDIRMAVVLFCVGFVMAAVVVAIRLYRKGK